MDEEKIFSPYKKFVWLSVALVGLFISVSTFVPAAYLFSLSPSVGIGVVVVGWLAANGYVTVLIVQAWRAKGMTRLVRNRAIAACVLIAPFVVVGVLLLWAAFWFVDAWG